MPDLGTPILRKFDTILAYFFGPAVGYQVHYDREVRLSVGCRRTDDEPRDACRYCRLADCPRELAFFAPVAWGKPASKSSEYDPARLPGVRSLNLALLGLPSTSARRFTGDELTDRFAVLTKHTSKLVTLDHLWPAEMLASKKLVPPAFDIDAAVARYLFPGEWQQPPAQVEEPAGDGPPPDLLPFPAFPPAAPAASRLTREGGAAS